MYKLVNNGNASGFCHLNNQWGISKSHINNCTWRVVYALFQFRNYYIRWPTKNKIRIKSIRNQDRKEFLGVVENVDSMDIVLQYKPGGVFHGKHFYTLKKRYSIDVCAVCNLQKRFIYTLADFSNTTHDL